MHFIVELLENKFPELLRLNRELSAVYEASRFKYVYIIIKLQAFLI